jgi:hypothetical protein
LNSPYTVQPADAFVAAQTSVGLVVAAVLWLRRLRPAPATIAMLLALFIIVVSPVEADFLRGIGVEVDATQPLRALKVAAALMTIATVFTGRLGLMTLAAAGQGALYKLTDYLQHSDLELAATHLAWAGLLVGLHLRLLPNQWSRPAAGGPRPRYGAWVDDVVIFALGTALAAATSMLLLHRWTNSGDEWANTYQAALFAKGHAFDAVPHCGDAFRNYWVFQYMGRAFAQYTPGWPYFITPFVWLHAPWLAGPAALGLLAVGTARLARRAAEGAPRGEPPPSEAHVRAAGRVAAGLLLLSSTVLINGASRYPHIFVAATFAWAVEALFSAASPDVTQDDEWGWGAVLGLAAGTMLATRPSDGAMLGVGLFALFVYELARGRLGWRAAVSATVGFGLVAGLTLLILRLQLGKWFTTGYSLAPSLYGWTSFGFSVPKPAEFKWSFPLATGSYCWWPCAPAIGLLGLGTMRGSSSRLTALFVLSFVPFQAFYTLFEAGRGWDLGYGPRFLLPAIVPMAVGGGAVLAHLWSAAASRGHGVRGIDAGGPAMLAMASVLVGVVRIAPLVYPYTYMDVVQVHNRLHEALASAHIHNAVVFAGVGLNNTDPLDLTENLPLDLYPDQDVLIALDKGPDVLHCVKERYPERTLYRAVPTMPVQIIPY